MFSDRYELTQAVLEGRKTMTRRIAYLSQHAADVLMGKIPDYPQGIVNSLWRKSKYKVGEIVAIAQPYCDIANESAELRDILADKAWRPRDEFRAGWNNKMFTRPSLLPHHIRITDIRVERLQSITKNECLKEGVELFETHSTNSGKAYTFPGVNESYITPLEAFAALIDKVSGKGAWDSNPCVFVYEFELVD